MTIGALGGCAPAQTTTQFGSTGSVSAGTVASAAT